MTTPQPVRILVTRHETVKLVGMWLDAEPIGGGRMLARNPITGRAMRLELGQYT